MKEYKYFNQYNYPNVLYPSKQNPKATIKSGGCGPTAMAMVVSSMTEVIVDPVDMALLARRVGARVNGGTDIIALSKAVSIYELVFKTTNDEAELIDHLRKGGMSIANVGGNRKGYIGVFSNEGHFIVVAGLTAEGKAIVLDPGYYKDKYNLAGRKGKVTISGNQCICDVSVLGKDTENRSPSYVLFSHKVQDETPVNIAVVIPGYLKKDRSYGPAREILGALGIPYSWDADTHSIVVKETKVPVVVKDGGRGYALVADLAKAIGGSAIWDEDHVVVKGGDN